MERGLEIPLILLGIEVLVILADWAVTKLRHETPLERTVLCPLDGQPAHQLLGDVRGSALSANLIRCSLLESGAARSCDRACLR